MKVKVQKVSMIIEVSNCMDAYFKFDEIWITFVWWSRFLSCRTWAMSFLLIGFAVQVLLPLLTVCQGRKVDSSYRLSLFSCCCVLMVSVNITDLPSWHLLLSAIQIQLMCWHRQPAGSNLLWLNPLVNGGNDHDTPHSLMEVPLSNKQISLETN